MTWYGSQHTSTRQLDSILSQNPTLAELLTFNDFIPQIKSYNSRLLDFLSHSPQIPKQLVSYIAQAPKDTDSQDRKYRLPLLAIEAIETEAMSLINAFYRIDKDGIPFLAKLFYTLSQTQDLLPLLAGYFYRVNLILINNKQKQAVDIIYNNSDCLKKLLRHTQIMAVTNTIHLYINLPLNKIASVPTHCDIKIQIIQQMFKIINQQVEKWSSTSDETIQNILNVLMETLDKNYLIVDGRVMIQTILSTKHIEKMFDIMLNGPKQAAYSVMGFFLAVLRYFCCSSINVDESPDTQKMDSIVTVKLFCQYFDLAIKKITNSQQFTLYHFKLLEVFCHCTTLSSNRIFKVLKQVNFYPTLINLMFVHEKNNILHMLVERAIRHLFITQKEIYKSYHKYLFCEINIIELTAGRFFKLIGDGGLQKAKQFGYFGHLLQIMKVYSAITTQDMEITNSIKRQSQLWTKVVQQLMNPYRGISSIQLGSFPDIRQPAPIQYTISKSQQLFQPKYLNNDAAIEEVKRQEATVPKNIDLQPKLQKQASGEFSNSLGPSQKQQEDSFFKVPELVSNIIDGKDDTQTKQQMPIAQQQTKTTKIQENIQQPKEQNQQLLFKPLQPATQKQQLQSQPKVRDFAKFLNQQKQQISKDKKMKRCASEQHKLSSRGSRFTSPSPSKKRNNWSIVEQSNEGNEKTKQKQKIPVPKPHVPMPISPKNAITNTSMIIEKSVNSQLSVSQNDYENLTKSMPNFSELKNIKVIRQKQSRSTRSYKKINDRDKLFLSYLGIVK